MHVEDEELKRAYRVIVETDDEKKRGGVSKDVVNDEELNDLIRSIRQPLTKEGMFQTLQRTARMDKLSNTQVLEPMLYQDDYTFHDEKQLREFQEIQKRTKMIRRKQTEQQIRDANKEKKKLLSEIDKMRDFFLKNFRLRGKLVSDREIRSMAGHSVLDFQQLKSLQKEVVRFKEEKQPRTSSR